MTKGVKWLIAAFALSLALNIFIVGVTFGKRVNGPQAHGEFARGRAPDFTLRGIARALPEGAQQQVKDLMRTERQNLRDSFAARNAARDEVMDLITSETVDLVALERALDEVSERTVALSAPLRRVFVEIVPDLTLEERRLFAKRLREARKHFRRNRPRASHD